MLRFCQGVKCPRIRNPVTCYSRGSEIKPLTSRILEFLQITLEDPISEFLELRHASTLILREPVGGGDHLVAEPESFQTVLYLELLQHSHQI
jgi:hypothetical protein